jgi:hypothetical protein
VGQHRAVIFGVGVVMLALAAWFSGGILPPGRMAADVDSPWFSSCS